MASGTRGVSINTKEGRAQINCGSGLARECAVSGTLMLADTAHSRASPLPQENVFKAGSLADGRSEGQLARLTLSGRIRGLITCGIQQ
ncbi:hypothetical protein C3E98_001570 [Pseudomonas sp. MWU13-2625]|nr:hypothetical protein C3E98_001570 [Pseudomonas sp. MWU13-2625]